MSLMADTGDQVSVFLRPFSSHMTSIALRTLADVMLKDEATSVIRGLLILEQK